MGHPNTKLKRTNPTPIKNRGEEEVLQASNVTRFSIALFT